MIKQGTRLGKVRVHKAHVLQKLVRYFKRVTVNTEDHSQRSRSLHLRDKQCEQFPTPQKEKPHKEKEEKR